MSDLIRRSDAIRVANEIPELIENHCFGEGEAERMMKEIPAVDAIKVVRCKNCIHSEKTPLQGTCAPFMHCMVFNRVQYGNFFCAHGVKRDGTVDNIE